MTPGLFVLLLLSTSRVPFREKQLRGSFKVNLRCCLPFGQGVDIVADVKIHLLASRAVSFDLNSTPRPVPEATTRSARIRLFAGTYIELNDSLD